jgi:UDP-glucuronate 4-epimerase
MIFLITGSSGFIGFHLSKNLLQNNHSVIGIDSHINDGSSKLKLSRLKILMKYDNFKFYKKNISQNLKSLNIKKKVDFVIHLAAQPGVRISIDKPISCIENNIKGTLEVFEFVKKNNIKNLIYASSSTVYGERRKSFTENLITKKPKSIYAISKISNEMMSDYYFKEFGVNSIGIRFFSIYGPMGREDMSYYKFLSDIKTKKKITVNGDGSIKRSFTHIDDAVECLSRLINFYKNKRKYNEIFNIGNSKTTTIKKIIEIIKRNTGTSFKIKYKKKFGVDNMVTRCDTKKLFKVIKFKPKIDIKEGLVDFIKWFNEKS